MKSKKILIGLLVLGMSLACSKSNEGSTATPEISYKQSIYSTTFYTSGNSAPPILTWKGDVGLFGLENSRPGVSIDPKTGIVSWSKTLPIGSGRSNEVKVLAYNNAGKTSEMIFIENKFTGKFKGSYIPGGLISIGSQFSGEFNFTSDGLKGALYASDDHGEILNTIPIIGSFTIKGNDITAEYTFVSTPEMIPRSIEAKLFYSETEAYIEGRFGVNLADGGLHSEFKFNLEIN